MSAPHSPLPWRSLVHDGYDGIAHGGDVHPDDSGWVVRHADANGEDSIALTDEDLAFIVRCVNAHDDLLAALKVLAKEAWGFISLNNADLRAINGHTNMECLMRRLEQAQAAIAKAEATDGQ